MFIMWTSPSVSKMSRSSGLCDHYIRHCKHHGSMRRVPNWVVAKIPAPINASFHLEFTTRHFLSSFGILKADLSCALQDTSSEVVAHSDSKKRSAAFLAITSCLARFWATLEWTLLIRSIGNSWALRVPYHAASGEEEVKFVLRARKPTLNVILDVWYDIDSLALHHLTWSFRKSVRIVWNASKPPLKKSPTN